MEVMAAFARAVVGRLELLGALTRERTAVKEEAQRSQQLQRTLDASLDMIATIGIDGAFKSMSQASRAILGYEPEELVGRSFMSLVHHDDRELSAKATAALVKGTSTNRFDNRCRRKDGSIAWIEWNIQYLSEEGVEARVRYKETFLRIKLERLAERENDQGDVLVVVQDLSEGRRLEASQQRFLANAAHQLSTPTMAILGAAELLATGDDADPTIRRRLLNHIFSEGHRMQQLSETLLRLSRVGWDQREPSLEILDLSRARQQATERMAPLIENMGLRVLVEDESTTTTCVRADPQWLQEVLLVLLSNAVKHSSRGADIRLRVSAGTITVEDEGAGISPDDLPHIFERFYRGKGSSEGFGLGLPICRELIERMGGSISISSREGVGTAVEIQLPEG